MIPLIHNGTHKTVFSAKFSFILPKNKKMNSFAGSIKVIFGFMQNGNCEKDKYLYDCNTELKGIAVNRL